MPWRHRGAFQPFRSVHDDGVIDACSASSRDTCRSGSTPSALVVLVNPHWAGVASERGKQRLRHILGVRLRLQHRVGVPHADAAVRQSASHQAQLQAVLGVARHQAGDAKL